MSHVELVDDIASGTAKHKFSGALVGIPLGHA